MRNRFRTQHQDTILRDGETRERLFDQDEQVSTGEVRVQVLNDTDGLAKELVTIGSLVKAVDMILSESGLDHSAQVRVYQQARSRIEAKVFSSSGRLIP